MPRLSKNLPCNKSTMKSKKNISLAEYIAEEALFAGYNFKGASRIAVDTARIATVTLRKFAQKTPLDAFLFAFTQKPDFFVGQVASNDGHDRVLLYTRILAQICQLEIPGFHEDLLRSFASNEELLEHFRCIATQLFSKSCKSSWTDEKRFDEIVHDMQTLLLQTHSLGFLTQKGLEVMQHMRNQILSSNASHIAQRPLCVELAEHFERVLRMERESSGAEHKALVEIYPTLEELTQSSDNVEQESPDELTRYESVVEYIDIHKGLLRGNFVKLLRTGIENIRETQTFAGLPRQTFQAKDVQIVITDQFLKTHRHQMLFVDVLGRRRGETNKMPFIRIKIGALLCLTTNYEFENLILATVACTDSDVVKSGFIGIEIQRQYNIGNIFGKNLIAFETPAFFEPYHNVYNFLSSCSVADFPMKDFVVFGETNVQVPDYLEEQTTYTYNNEKFRPLHGQSPKKMCLDASQKVAYINALKEKFCLIEGPPGTGKSELSMHLLKTLVENRPTPIVLITSCNESLDKFLLKFSDFTRQMVRFGDKTRRRGIAKYNAHHVTGDRHLANPKLKHLYYLADLEFKQQFQLLRSLQTEFNGSDESYHQILAAQHLLRTVKSKLHAIRILFQYYTLRKESVIAMTTSSVAKTNFLFRLLESSIVIFEEAGEIIDSHVAACLTPYTQHVIMIGDPRSQLCEMNVSFFERMIRLNMKRSVLKIQYRMRPSIADLICPLIYEELRHDESVENYPLVRKMSKNVYFLTHETKGHRKRKCLMTNRFEIDKLISLAKYLIIQAGYAAADILVLSPYAPQIDSIKCFFAKYSELNRIRTVTVDSFKGLEANIVLLSLASSIKHDQIGFLCRKQICVALTRAKQGLYIVGNLELLETCDSTWCVIKERLRAQDAIGREFPYEE